MDKNTDISYRSSFAYISKGIVILGICLWRTFVECATDIAKCFVKHPVALLFILASIGYSFYSMATARAERDHYAKENYAQEVTIDSLEILLGK